MTEIDKITIPKKILKHHNKDGKLRVYELGMGKFTAELVYFRSKSGHKFCC